MPKQPADSMASDALSVAAGSPPGGVTEDMIDACGREQIQFLGHVQDFGCLLVVTTQWVVRNASANCGAVLGHPPEALIAQRLTDVLPASTMHTLRGKVQVMGRGEGGIRLFGIDVFEDGRRFDIAIHRDGPTFLIEFEAKRPGQQKEPAATVQSLMPRLAAAEGQGDLSAIAADAVWALTGFDRVMVYRFEPDFSGVVVAETLNGSVASYMGHRFPASDIPPQARALYRRNLMRIIADVDAPVHPIVPPQTPAGGPTDLSLSSTRAVSPIHLQYLRNMGVKASMSVSIMVEGDLWGMIACHHEKPHYVDYETRSAIELFAQLLAYELGLRDQRDEAAQANAAMSAHEQLTLLFESAAPARLDLAGVAQDIDRVLQVDGLAMLIGEQYHSSGLAPDRAGFARLMAHVDRNGLSRVFATDHLTQASPGTLPPDSGIGGILAIPIHSRPGDGVILFRREVTHDIVWAGRPDKDRLPDGRLSPRTSFSAWRETRRGFCAAWTPGDLRAAEVLRVSLLELTLRLSADRDRATSSRNERQEVVIAELTHRLRNVYTTVSAVIAAAAAGDPALGAFAAEMQDRLVAMKRANDVLTSRDGGTMSLTRMILDEVRAYAGGGGGRVTCSGGDVLLSPEQRAALTLVIHELTTNAVKYGSLGPSGGQLSVEFRQDADGIALIWRESGGPRVALPQRTGFGSALIEQTVPHELGGRVETRFDPEGVEVRLHLPGLQLVADSRPQAAAPRPADRPTVAPVRLLGRVLVVEDNTIIAMNAAQTLRRLGAEDVVIAATPDAAMAALDGPVPVRFALLDQDLGGLSSRPVAERLTAEGVPFVMATGMAHAGRAADGALADAVWIEKPYNSDAIAEALHIHFADRLGGGGADTP